MTFSFLMRSKADYDQLTLGKGLAPRVLFAFSAVGHSFKGLVGE